MKVSLNWIRRYVDLPLEITEKQIVYDLTMRTVEVEDVIDTSEKFKDIVIGKIVEIKPHPDADRLRVCLVDCGLEEPKQIVCGGSNLYVGEPVVVCKPGSYVVWHGEGEPVKIKESKLRGVKSFGMISASDEIYLGNIYPDEPSHIMDLSKINGIKEEDLIPGTNIAEVIGIKDVVLDIDNKSLTNRPDLWGHYGIAREIAAIYKLPLKDLNEGFTDDFEYKKLPEYKVSIEDTTKCKRYTALKIEGLHVKQSPPWMQIAILNAGMQPKNALVDITNYVMLASGQPTHAFDASQVEGEQIIVRNAKKGEKILLLDDEDLELTTDDLVICDEAEPMGLAGIRGGKKDSILPDTTSVVLEVANFTPESIRKTEKRFGEKTDAGIRFEKGIDTERVDAGLTLAVALFKNIYPEGKFTAYGEVCDSKTECAIIDVSQDFLDRRIGTPLEESKVIDTLIHLGYEVKVHSSGAAAIDPSIRKDSNGIPLNDKFYHITVPTWRSTGDVSIRDDVLGDLTRLIGYENFESRPLPLNFDSAVKQLNEDLERKIKEYFSFRCGFYEIFTYPWVAKKYINAAGVSVENAVRLATPPAPEQANLRSSLVPGLLEAAEKNLRYFDEFNLYEMAEVFEKGNYCPSSDDEILPVQKMMLSGISVANTNEKAFYDIKGVLESMSRFCHMEAFEFKQIEKPSWADSNAYLNIICDGIIVGCLALVSAKALHEAGIDNASCAIFEIEMIKLVPFKSRTNKYEALPIFPLVEEDLSILVDEGITWNQIYETIYRKCNKVSFKEVYRGKQIPKGKKSVMLSVLLGSDKGTLNSKQIDKRMKVIIDSLNKFCGAELRG